MGITAEVTSILPTHLVLGELLIYYRLLDSFQFNLFKKHF